VSRAVNGFNSLSHKDLQHFLDTLTASPKHDFWKPYFENFNFAKIRVNVSIFMLTPYLITNCSRHLLTALLEYIII